MSEGEKAPLVSVIVPVYNQENYVVTAIDSIIQQDYPCVEILVCDDRSTDSTVRVVREFIDQYTGHHVIRFYENEQNKGISLNVNFLIEAACGEYICFFSGDDVMYPGKISAQVAYMEAHPRCRVSYHDVSVFESEGDKHLYYYSERHTPRSGGYEELIRHQSFNCGCANMARMNPKVYCDTRVKYASDWLHFIEILYLGQGEIHYIDKVLAGYRRHSNNTTKKDAATTFAEVTQILDLLDARLPGNSSLINKVRGERMMTYGIKFLIEKKVLIGLRVFWGGIFKSPSSIGGFLKNTIIFLRSK